MEKNGILLHSGLQLSMKTSLKIAKSHSIFILGNGVGRRNNFRRVGNMLH